MFVVIKLQKNKFQSFSLVIFLFKGTLMGECGLKKLNTFEKTIASSLFMKKLQIFVVIKPNKRYFHLLPL